jgi:hypothetical protein
VTVREDIRVWSPLSVVHQASDAASPLTGPLVVLQWLGYAASGQAWTDPTNTCLSAAVRHVIWR